MREGARGLVGEEAGRATPEGDLAQLQHYSCSGSNSELREPRTLRLIKPQLQTAGFKGSPPGLIHPGNGGKWWENGGNFTKTYETNFWG